VTATAVFGRTLVRPFANVWLVTRLAAFTRSAAAGASTFAGLAAARTTSARFVGVAARLAAFTRTTPPRTSTFAGLAAARRANAWFVCFAARLITGLLATWFATTRLVCAIAGLVATASATSTSATVGAGFLFLFCVELAVAVEIVFLEHLLTLLGAGATSAASTLGNG
jgi:hypothetical protein